MSQASEPSELGREWSERTGDGREVQYGDPTLYINRELSWLRFNARVLEEALDEKNRLLDRVRFLSIFASNLDEFFMIRVSGLRRQLAAGVLEAPPDGMSPAEQLAAIRERLLPDLARASQCWRQDLLPRLGEAGVRVVHYSDLRDRERVLVRRHFHDVIFPVLTPLAFDPAHPFPHISNLSLNLGVVVRDAEHGERFARVKVPQTFPRLLPIPREGSQGRLGLGRGSSRQFVWLEQVIAENLDLLFPGLEIVSAHPFRVTRDADFEIEEDEASDLLTAMAEVVGQRHFGSVVRVEVVEEMAEGIRQTLVRNLDLAPYQVFSSPGPLGLADLVALADVNVPELREPPFLPRVRPSLAQEEGVFAVLRRDDVLLYHPYDSFAPVVSFVAEAARDPDVLAIKQTLYRTGPNSPFVEALKEARENGKQVAAVVELKARFDEENNIVWARELEAAGVHVVYGLVGLKTHAKMCLVARREDDGIRRYVHLSTGNYNAQTARIYGDVGYFTCDPAIADDVSHLFNALTGYSRKRDYEKLIVAPHGMRLAILERIEREIAQHERRGDGYLAFKMNALVDRPCIDALYRASQAGVRVELQVRGICCLRPGIPGLSENVRVTSIVGRFLEHARIYYFHNAGEDEVLVGSADLMPRNLDGRVEVLFPVDNPRLRNAVRDDILFLQLRDEAKNRILSADGAYVRAAKDDGDGLDSQRWLLANGGAWQREE